MVLMKPCRRLLPAIMDGDGGVVKIGGDGGAGGEVNVELEVLRCRDCHFGVSSILRALVFGL